MSHDRKIAMRAINAEWYRKPHATKTHARVHRLAIKRVRQAAKKANTP